MTEDKNEQGDDDVAGVHDGTGYVDGTGGTLTQLGR